MQKFCAIGLTLATLGVSLKVGFLPSIRAASTLIIACIAAML
jgi:hypothetical protein